MHACTPHQLLKIVIYFKSILNFSRHRNVVMLKANMFLIVYVSGTYEKTTLGNDLFLYSRTIKHTFSV